MANIPDWVPLPTGWISDGGLKDFRWRDGKGADNTAALMALIAIAHHADPQTGIAKLTYDRLTACIDLSRAKLSAGLAILEEKKIISREPLGRSSYGVLNHRAPPWGKLPAKRLYHDNRIVAFTDFRLRSPIELSALKLFLLFVERRNNANNLAQIGYDKIEEYSGIERRLIRSAISLLTVNSLVHVESQPSIISEHGISNAYRFPQIDRYNHMGTRGRSLD